MIVFPNCKINLGLHITSKRADGFHNLETVFYPLIWTDALEAVKSESDSLTLSGIPVPGNAGDNICFKAAELLRKDFPQISRLSIHLHKTIPAGAGLGGGSADGAFMLLLLNHKYNLQLSDRQLITYAGQLGSDCPFFIVNKPCFASGRGEVLHPVDLCLDNYSFLVIHPGIHVNTGWAFTQITPASAATPLTEIIRQPVEKWKKLLVNDFEVPVFKKYPEIGQLKETLYRSGALYASMTGSGSSLYGIFPKEMLPELGLDNDYIVKKIA